MTTALFFLIALRAAQRTMIPKVFSAADHTWPGVTLALLEHRPPKSSFCPRQAPGLSFS